MARIAAAELERLKSEVSVERLVESAGVALKRAGKDKQAVSRILGAPDFVAPDGTYQSYTVKNAETKGIHFPGIVVLDVRFAGGVVRELVIRPV